ncbi:MAG: hypothetical protein Q4G67_08275 [Actinomycetia bacterium]|nr:hypothetical protein [Actinomycetes bacterium]
MSRPYPTLADQPFLPVIVGAHVGAYSIARAFHEEYQVRSVIVSSVRTWVTDHSAILEVVHCDKPLDPDALAATLRSPRIGGLPIPKIVVATSDTLVDTLGDLGDRVGDDITIPYVGAGPRELATRKHTFAEVAARAGVSQPDTRVLDLAQPDFLDTAGDSPFPAIIKPTTPGAWAAVDFAGKSKVHTVTSRAELTDLVTRIHASGYRDKLILQDRIPGDDTGMRILTCYCDQQSRVRFASYGRTLIEEHAPGLLGVPAGILTGQNSEIVDQAARLLKELQWVGYANFDLKFDPRDGVEKFFELNPRLGRSNYYVTGAGINPVRYYVDDWINGTLPDGDDRVESTERTVYSVVPKRTLKWALAPHPELWREVRQVISDGGMRNPLHYKAERDPRRWAKVLAAGVSYDRKFRTYYDPEAAAKDAVAESVNP